MFFESLAAAIHPHFQPPLLFVCGLLLSMLVCTLSMLIDPNLRVKRLFVTGTRQVRGYQQFRDQLARSSRHVDFADDEVFDLRDDEFLPT